MRCTQPRNTTGLVPCTQEEADTKIFLHVSDAASHGYDKVMILTDDIDVLVLSISAVQQLTLMNLWVAFASGKSFRYLQSHKMAGALGTEKCIALPFPHTFSGCDTVSFAGHEMKTMWEILKTFNEVTSALHTLASTPSFVDY